jgi:hypothetical protein
VALRCATSEIRRLGPGTAWKFSLFILACLLGCSRPPSQPADAAPQSSIADVARITEQIRALAFKRQVTLSAQRANASANDLAQTSPQLAQVYQRLGLVADSVDWANAYAEFSKLERAASYDAAREVIFVAPAFSLAATGERNQRRRFQARVSSGGGRRCDDRGSAFSQP